MNETLGWELEVRQHSKLALKLLEEGEHLPIRRAGSAMPSRPGTASLMNPSAASLQARLLFKAFNAFSGSTVATAPPAIASGSQG